MMNLKNSWKKRKQKNRLLEFDALTEMIGLDLSKLPLDVLNIKENELINLLDKYDEIAHVN